MSTKNIILTIVCIVCAFFVFKRFYKFYNPGSPTFDQELIRCEIIKDWLKKKNFDEYANYGISETLATKLEKYDIRLNRNVQINPEVKLGAFFAQVKTANVKCVVFNDPLRPTDNTDDVVKYLKSGGSIYFRSFSNELNDNKVFINAVLEAMKKGQVCVVLDRFGGDVRKMSMKERVLAENIFIDDANWVEFENWHKQMVKLKAEFMGSAPPR